MSGMLKIGDLGAGAGAAGDGIGMRLDGAMGTGVTGVTVFETTLTGATGMGAGAGRGAGDGETGTVVGVAM